MAYWTRRGRARATAVRQKSFRITTKRVTKGNVLWISASLAVSGKLFCRTAVALARPLVIERSVLQVAL
jgi:hypothetical protein